MRNFLIHLIILLFMAAHVSARTVGNATDSPAGASASASVTETVPDHVSVSGSAIKPRRRRFISQNDMLAIVDYHNQVRARVFPPAANMEYMVSDPRPITHPVRSGRVRSGRVGSGPVLSCPPAPLTHEFGNRCLIINQLNTEIWNYKPSFLY